MHQWKTAPHNKKRGPQPHAADLLTCQVVSGFTAGILRRIRPAASQLAYMKQSQWRKDFCTSTQDCMSCLKYNCMSPGHANARACNLYHCTFSVTEIIFGLWLIDC
jgi:hypothetical protein